jgi:hypothetical protein
LKRQRTGLAPRESSIHGFGGDENGNFNKNYVECFVV